MALRDLCRACEGGPGGGRRRACVFGDKSGGLWAEASGQENVLWQRERGLGVARECLAMRKGYGLAKDLLHSGGLIRSMPPLQVAQTCLEEMAPLTDAVKSALQPPKRVKGGTELKQEAPVRWNVRAAEAGPTAAGREVAAMAEAASTIAFRQAWRVEVRHVVGIRPCACHSPTHKHKVLLPGSAFVPKSHLLQTDIRSK